MKKSFRGPMVRIPPFQGGGSCSIHGGCIATSFVLPLSRAPYFAAAGVPSAGVVEEAQHKSERKELVRVVYDKQNQ